jgi:hypothetical protein
MKAYCVWRYSSVIDLGTMDVSGQLQARAALLPEKQLLVPIGYAGWAPEPVWTLYKGEKSNTTAGNRTLAVQPLAVPTQLSRPRNRCIYKYNTYKASIKALYRTTKAA